MIARKEKQYHFREKIQQWVEAGIAAGARDFDDLLSHLPSVYPANVTDALSALWAKNSIDSVALFHLRLSTQIRQLHRSVYSKLPPPHPLDFELSGDLKLRPHACCLILP